MKNPEQRYHVEPAYACTDLARSRKASQDIVGYDVRDRLTGIVESPCETEDAANTEAERLNASTEPSNLAKTKCRTVA